MSNFIYEKFHESKQMFKPFISWPDRVHLGLNNVDSISNSLLKKIRLKNDEHVLWISLHKGGFSFKNNDEDSLKSDGVIITDKRINYFDENDNKNCFSIAWSEVVAIIHQMNSFYVQTSRSEKSWNLKISDYAMLGKKVDNKSQIVVFFREISENAAKATTVKSHSDKQSQSNFAECIRSAGNYEKNAQSSDSKMARTASDRIQEKAGKGEQKEVKQSQNKTRRSFL